jgi:hypothetical protein
MKEREMKTKVFLLILIITTPLLTASTRIGDRLVLIQKGESKSLTILTEFQVTPHLKGEEWVLASVSSQSIDRIVREGFEIEIVDDDPWSGNYFFVTQPGVGYPSYLPGSFREIARVPEGLIVKSSQGNVAEILELGLRIVRIRDKAIPLVERVIPQFKGITPGWYNTGRSIVDQVSDSTITEYMTRLVDYQTRYSCTDSIEAAGQWIHDFFVGLGFTDVSFDTFPFDQPAFPCDLQRNIVAVKRGSLDPDKVIVIGGHYDSVTYSQDCDPDTLAPGADDNATGTVVTMEAARVLFSEETDKTLIFVAFGAEEQGIIGSGHFAQEAYDSGMDIYVMLNMDMVAYEGDGEWDVEISSPSISQPFAQAVMDIALIYTDLLPFYVPSTGADDFPFYQLGYSTVAAEEGDWPSPQWHQCEDTIENLSLPYLVEVAEMITASTLYFANTPAVPTRFNVVNVGDGTSLYLSWDPNDESDLAGYNIYWGTQSGVYDSVRTVTATNETIRDLINGNTYYLAISAIDTDDNESFLTEEVDITASSRPMTPTGIASTSLDTAVIIEWVSSQGELDLAGYNLFRWIEDAAPDTILHAFIADPGSSYFDISAEVHTLYGYHVTAVDTQVPPNESDPSEAVFGRLVTHDMGILIVDNTTDGTGGPFNPTDEEVDAFYSEILGSYNAQALWDAADSVSIGRHIMDYDTGIYAVVLWHSDMRGGRLADSDTTTMRKYLEGGGNLWLSGWQLLAFLTGGSSLYYVFQEDDFVGRYVGIDSARVTSTSDQDFIGAESRLSGFPSVFVDSAKVYPLGAMYNTDILLPPFGGANRVYDYISSDSANSEYHGLPVGVASRSTDYGLVVTDFPLYFMDQGDAELLVDAVMEMFEEPVGIGDREVAGLPRAFSLSQNYPNPFNPSTTIGYEIPDNALKDTSGNRERVPVSIYVYDVRGRLVRRLVDQEKDPGTYRVHWNGRDDRGETVSSGVYLYKIKAGDFTSVRKMVLVR